MLKFIWHIIRNDIWWGGGGGGGDKEERTLQTEQFCFSGYGSLSISTVCNCWGWDIYVVLWCVTHSLLRKGTGITSDWLSFHLISLDFTLLRIRLSLPLWSSRKTQLPLLGPCQGHLQDIAPSMGCLWGSFCHCGKQDSAASFPCSYWFDSSTNGKTSNRRSSERTWSRWHSAHSSFRILQKPLVQGVIMVTSYSASHAIQLHMTTSNTSIISCVSICPRSLCSEWRCKGLMMQQSAQSPRRNR